MNEDFEWIRTHIEELVEKYAGNYVAAVEKRVVVVNKSGKLAEDKALTQLPGKEPLVFPVPKKEDFNCLLSFFPIRP